MDSTNAELMSFKRMLFLHFFLNFMCDKHSKANSRSYIIYSICDISIVLLTGCVKTHCETVRIQKIKTVSCNKQVNFYHIWSL